MKTPETVMADIAKEYFDDLWANSTPEWQRPAGLALRPVVEAYIKAFVKTYRYYPKCQLLWEGRISFYGNILHVSILPAMTKDLVAGVDSWKVYNKSKFIGIIESNYPSAYAYWSKKTGFKLVPFNDKHLRFPYKG